MNLLITGAWKEAKEYISELEGAGHQIQFLQYEKDPLPCQYEWVEGVICNSLFIHHQIVLFTKLQYIQLTSAGYDRVPLDYIHAQGIELHNAKDVYSIPMAEYAVSGVLQLYKEVRAFTDRQRQHMWEKKFDLQELYGKTVCIVGCGNVGTECAKRFAAFGCNILGIRKHSINVLNEILPETDILLLTLPLNKNTLHLINSENLLKLKKGAVVVNLSRGAVIETEALIDVLRTGHISGAVLDVFEEEPLPSDSILWDMENVIITPHISYAGKGIKERLWKCIKKYL